MFSRYSYYFRYFNVLCKHAVSILLIITISPWLVFLQTSSSVLISGLMLNTRLLVWGSAVGFQLASCEGPPTEVCEVPGSYSWRTIFCNAFLHIGSIFFSLFPRPTNAEHLLNALPPDQPVWFTP